ncbi:MAG: rhodanese-like domain-containing protein [Thermoanaerobaculum sp.]|nr:rhodanese-like domain-containing protein [Thermoanaerobaculum sp.]
MVRWMKEAAVLLAAVLVLGTLANLLPARHIAWWGKGLEPPRLGQDFQRLDVDSAHLMWESLPQVVFVDTRTAAEYAAGHIPGALRLELPSLASMLTPHLREQLTKAHVIVLYGSSLEGDEEQLLAQALRREIPALPMPYVLVGGFPMWQAAGYPTEVQP